MKDSYLVGILILLAALLIGCGVQNKRQITENSSQSTSTDTTIINCTPKIVGNVPEEIVRFKSRLSQVSVYDVFILKNGYTSSLVHIAIDSTKSIRKTYGILSDTFDLRETEEKPISLDSLDFRSGTCEVVFYTNASDRCEKDIFVYKRSELIYSTIIIGVGCSDALLESIDLKNIKQLKTIW